MLKRNEGVDIVAEIGGIHSIDEAKKLFEEKMDCETLAKLKKIENTEALLKIANSIVMCKPDNIFINTGTPADVSFVKYLALKKGEEKPLPMIGHTIHFDLKGEQGRLVDKTYYIYNENEDISSLAKKQLRADALVDIKEKMTGIMQGHTMVIGFYSRGPVGSPVSNPAIEITSSAYVCHSAELLYRNTYNDFDKEAARLGHFFTNIHSEGLNRDQDLENARVYMDRSHWTTYSIFCTYAGNTLLMKKGNHRFAVDKAVYINRNKELSEHMFITGIVGPDGRETWIAGAAPSGCGKTTTAMAGNLFVGDDLAQMWIDDNGCVKAINPEAGIFGIVEDVNWEGDPELMKLIRNPKTEVIWSNVCISEAGVPYWTGSGEAYPEKGFNFQGEWYKGKTDANGKEIPISHPNSRCTLRSNALANYSEKAEDPNGVHVKIVTYSGRDADTMPPVWAALNSDHGVVIGASIVSAATATEVGSTGVKRAPWANAPFIPGALGDYMDAQFKFYGSDNISKGNRPIMAGLNYFLTHEARGGEGKKLLGEKKDVKVWLAWLERLVHHEVSSIKTPMGLIPKYAELKKLFSEIIDKEYTEDLYNKQFSFYIDNMLARIELQKEAYSKDLNVPERLFEVYDEQQKSLEVLKEKYGQVVTPKQLEEYNK
ncbi:MAG: phosphoenolpyruvate carboxykinase (GTP) [Pseudomonadota bacterium]